MASLYVFYRDLNQVWDVILQAIFFLSPTMYPMSTIPEKYIPIYMLNPLTILMTTFRDILLYGKIPSLLLLVFLTVFSIFTFIVCRFIFKRLERRFAEEV
jgi:lipopolysaccharide transport system permease protein